MKSGIKISCAMLVLAVFAACAKPVTRAPKLELSEVEAERQYQQQMAKESQPVDALDEIKEQEVIERMNKTSPAVLKAGEEVCYEMRGNRQDCTFYFQIEKRKEINAYADGNHVIVTPAIVSLTQTQEELAMVLAHEYAHNILEHPQGTGKNVAVGSIVGAVFDQVAGSQGIPTGGALSKLGSSAALYHYSVDFEKEADYVGLYIMVRAGFDLERGMNIWRKLSLKDPNGLYTTATHPGNPERVVAMKKTIAEIKGKKARGASLLPEMRK